MTNNIKEIEILINKAAEANDSGDAMRFSQAACNAVNALFTLKELQKPYNEKNS